MGTVLVVGGRTTGLMMAAELARHGMPVRIVDQSPGIDPHVRANLLHSRTLEIFQSLGLADRATVGSIAEHGVRVFVGGRLAGEIRHEPVDSPFPFGMSQSQAWTEAMLEAHLNGLGVGVERSVTLSALAAHGDRVIATLVHSDGRAETVEAPWVIGCDGAHSAVRQLIGCAFPGDEDPFPYLIADVAMEGDLAEDHAHIFLHDEGELFVFTAMQGGHRLVCANLAKGAAAAGAPSLEQIQSLVTRRGLPGVRVSDPRWLATFRIHYRLAPLYRQGRIFLAGDAAHVHSLLGGQGMNTGIQDAHNLGWKLAFVMRGDAPEWWLDTYEAERRRIAEDVVATTRLVTERAELFAGVSPREREKLLTHMFVPDHERLRAARHLQEVDLDYRASPLCIESDDDFDAGPPAGARAPDATPIFVDGTRLSLLRLLTGPPFRLLLFAGMRRPQDDDALRAGLASHKDLPRWIEPCLVVAGASDRSTSSPGGITCIDDRDGVMHRRYGANEPCVYLVRPDGYVAHRSRRIESLMHYLRVARRRGVTTEPA